MNTKGLIIFSLVLSLSLFITGSVLAEDKSAPGGIIPKLPQTVNDPELIGGRVYPNWGPPCQRYTYSVFYRDKEGRKPAYMQIYFNGKMIDMFYKKDKNEREIRYELWEIPSGKTFNKAVHFMVYECPSAKLHGEQREYAKGVPPFRTVAECMAWGMSDDVHTLTPEEWKKLVPLEHES